VKASYENIDSFLIAQREFQKQLGINRNRAVPSAHVINTWVRKFEAAGSTLKDKGGSVETVCTLENIAVVRVRVVKEVDTVLRVDTVSLGLSEASIRRTLHKDLHFYPYKLQVTHAIHERDCVNSVNSRGDASKSNGRRSQETCRVPRVQWWSSE
jgi:hypothetical protein